MWEFYLHIYFLCVGIVHTWRYMDMHAHEGHKWRGNGNNSHESDISPLAHGPPLINSKLVISGELIKRKAFLGVHTKARAMMVVP